MLDMLLKKTKGFARDAITCGEYSDVKYIISAHFMQLYKSPFTLLKYSS